MRFRDIKQFISRGSYEIDVPLKSVKRNLDKFEEDYGLELNPDFQRGHVWTEEQQTAYVEFLLRGGVTARVIYFNSPAFGSRVEGDLDDTVVCVDGLQRLTACLRFLNDEIKVFGLFYSEYEDEPGMLQGLKFNVNCLPNREDILEWYIQFNSGGTVHTEEEIDRVKKLLEEEKNKKGELKMSKEGIIKGLKELASKYKFNIKEENENETLQAKNTDGEHTDGEHTNWERDWVKHYYN